MPGWLEVTIYCVGALAGFSLYWCAIEDDVTEEPLCTPFWLRMVFLLGFTVLWPISFCLAVIYLTVELKQAQKRRRGDA